MTSTDELSAMNVRKIILVPCLSLVVDMERQLMDMLRRKSKNEPSKKVSWTIKDMMKIIPFSGKYSWPFALPWFFFSSSVYGSIKRLQRRRYTRAKKAATASDDVELGTRQKKNNFFLYLIGHLMKCVHIVPCLSQLHALRILDWTANICLVCRITWD